MPFAVPRGRLASWVAGRMMLAVSQQEVADLLGIPPGRPGADRLARRPEHDPHGPADSLPYRTLSRIEQELSELFTGTERHELENMTAFTATR